jgi:hypothetical protein
MIAIALAVALALAPAVSAADEPHVVTGDCFRADAGAVSWPDGFPSALADRKAMGAQDRFCTLYPGGPSFAVWGVDADAGEFIWVVVGGDEAEVGTAADWIQMMGGTAEDYTAVGLTPPAEVEVPTDGPTATPEPQVPTAEPTPELPAAPFDPLPLIVGGTIIGGLATGAVVWFTLRRRPVGEKTEEGL